MTDIFILKEFKKVSLLIANCHAFEEREKNTYLNVPFTHTIACSSPKVKQRFIKTDSSDG